MLISGSATLLRVQNYNLEATLNSGQAFRWDAAPPGWEGVVAGRWVHLVQTPEGIRAQTAAPCADWHWLAHYLQSEIDLESVLRTFPTDPPMRAALEHTRGLRLLRQDPWECLAAFICSSTKQIVQIRQIIASLCACFGTPVAVPAGHLPAFAFPGPETLAARSEADLRACKLGFRAPYLRACAQEVASGRLDLPRLAQMEVGQAREQLMRLPGVGEKIANCVLLFAYPFPTAFPLDVWVKRAIQRLYFPKRKVHVKRLASFVRGHFGPHAGYAQQYLFHYMRTRKAL